MHTSSGVDDIDEYLETVDEEGRRLRLQVRRRGAAGDRRARSRVPYKTATGMAQKEFTVYRTHHGPVVREADGKWVSVRLMQEPLKALHAVVLAHQGERTTRRSARRWSCTPTRRTTRSSPTPTATSPTSTRNFIPKRDPKFDWTKPVDGSDPATEWHGLLSVDETPAPAQSGERLALQHATTGRGRRRVRAARSGRTIRRTSRRGSEESAARLPRAARARRTRRTSRSTSLIAAAFDSYLPAFDELIPPLLKAYDAAPACESAEGEARRADRRCCAAGTIAGRVTSVPTSLAVFWGEELGAASARRARGGVAPTTTWRQRDRRRSCCRRSPPRRTSSPPTSARGRRRGATSTASSASPATSSSRSTTRRRAFRSASRRRAGARSRRSARARIPDTKKMVRHKRQQLRRRRRVRRQRARAAPCTAGGESGDPEVAALQRPGRALRTGNLRDVYFYRADVEKHTERQYHPGQ